MKVFVLIMSDRDMRPLSDMTTTAVFLEREDALAAMENDIKCAIENEQISDAEVERYPKSGFAVSLDKRFMWKIEERIICPRQN